MTYLRVNLVRHFNLHSLPQKITANVEDDRPISREYYRPVPCRFGLLNSTVSHSGRNSASGKSLPILAEIITQWAIIFRAKQCKLKYGWAACAGKVWMDSKYERFVGRGSQYNAAHTAKLSHFSPIHTLPTAHLCLTM